MNRLISLVCIGWLLNCSNYGLYDKMANPDGQTSKRLYAFVSSVPTQGNLNGLVAPGCSGSGLARADCYCQQAAAAANLIGKSPARYVAYLADDTNDMTCRISGRMGTGWEPDGNRMRKLGKSHMVLKIGTGNFSGLRPP